MNDSARGIIGRAVTRIWITAGRVDRTAYVVGAALFLSGLAHLVFLLVSGGSWLGPLSMRKPTTFGLSFGLTLASVVWAISYIPMRASPRALLVAVFTAVSVVETVLVSLQAWRGVPSHFNFETPFDNAVSMTLAAGGGVIILTVLGFTAAALVGVGALSPSMRLAVRAGLLGLLVSLAVGGMMIATGVTAARSGNPQVAYDTAGAMKPAHFVAMHAILVLPGLAWLMGFTDWAERRRIRLVWVAIVGYAALIAVVAVESYAGVSPLAAPLIETVLSVAAMLALMAVGGLTLTRLLRVGAGQQPSEPTPRN